MLSDDVKQYKKILKKLFNPGGGGGGGGGYLFKVHEIKFVLMVAFRDEFRPFVDKVRWWRDYMELLG